MKPFPNVCSMDSEVPDNSLLVVLAKPLAWVYFTPSKDMAVIGLPAGGIPAYCSDPSMYSYT